MMRRIRLLGLVLIGATVLCTVALSLRTQTASAAGGVGSGGTGGNSDSSGHWTKYGWGWRLYDVTSNGPSEGFRNGSSWSVPKNACLGNSTKIAVFLILDAQGNGMGYDYQTKYYSPSIYLGYKSGPLPWISVPTAKKAYDALPSAIRSGHTWGGDVGWFCYDYITAKPPATLDGVKIDNSKVGTYGGATGAAYDNLKVSVSGAGSDTANPFYFSTARGGGGTDIPIGTTGTTAHTVSIVLPAPVSGYKLIGYSICYTGQTNCSNVGLTYRGAYYKSLPAGTSSFTFNFVSDRNYHMRWVFQSIVGVNCGDFDTTPQSLDGRTSFSAAATVLFDALYAPVSPTVKLSIAPAVNFNGNAATVVPAITSAGGDSTATATFGTNALKLGPTLATGVYTATWTYDDATLATPKVCTDTFEVTNQPYLHVYGGDTMAGNAVIGDTQGSAQECAQNDEAGIYSWNNHSSDFSGAGAQYAVMALDQILDFSSASASPTGTNGTPVGLSFANSGLPATQLSSASGNFGGHFGGITGGCDFTSDITTPANTTSDEQIGGRTVAVNTSDIHYVVGHDVFITGNIMYAGTGAWTSVDQIPYFKVVVVGGNIYIDKGVTDLSGVYIAEQDDEGLGGKIFTCATSSGGSGLQAVDPLSAGYYTNCKNKLNIYGAFAAQQIQFLRTSGTIGMASADTWNANNSAETFIYSPEVWLPRNTASPQGTKYDAITGLPPNL